MSFVRNQQQWTYFVSDEWSNVQNRPTINILAVNAEGAVFLDACDTSGEIKDVEYAAE